MVQVTEIAALNQERPRSAALRLLRTGVLIAGSAFLGGLAVVFWNRKTLAQLRQPPSDLVPQGDEAGTA